MYNHHIKHRIEHQLGSGNTSEGRWILSYTKKDKNSGGESSAFKNETVEYIPVGKYRTQE